MSTAGWSVKPGRCFCLNFADWKKPIQKTGESLHVLSALADVINRKMTAVSYQYHRWNGKLYNATCFISQLPLPDRYFQGIAYWDTDEEFEKAFHTAYRFQMKCLSDQESRLVEAAMHAPQWIDLIVEHLSWKGLKSGCYYFMAHMDERFDDRKIPGSENTQTPLPEKQS